MAAGPEAVAVTTPDDGYVAFDSPALEAERRVLEARPEQPAATAINAMVIDAAATLLFIFRSR